MPIADRHRTKKLTVLSAFTGAGGLDVGLEAAGFRPVACIEQDSVACETIAANRPDWPVPTPRNIQSLLPELTPRALRIRRRSLHMLAGGPPCQPFSKAAQWAPGAGRGLRDPRSDCLIAFFELVRRFLPATFFIENVPGFVQGRRSALPFIEAALGRINEKEKTAYEIHCRILNAADFGVPQRRERAILVARRDGKSWTWPSPTHRDSPCRAWDAIGDLKPSNGGPPSGFWGELLSSVPEGWNYQWFTEGGDGRKLFGYRTKYWSFLLKLAKSQPAWTLPAHPGPATGPFHWDNRRLTAKEMLRLQSFPASWKVCGTYADQVRQIGNATPPLLAEVIGREIAQQAFGVSFGRPPRLQIRRKRDVPRPRRATPVRKKKYLVLEGSHAPHPGTGKGPRPVLKEAPARV